jgi:hypothetical protein
MRLPPCPPSQGNCSRQGETRCRPRSFFPPRSARETEEMEKWSFQRTRELMTPRALRGIAVNEIGRARISMMVRSMSSNSRPDTLVQDRTPQPHRFLLQRTAGPYIGVKHFQTLDDVTNGSQIFAERRPPGRGWGRQLQCLRDRRRGLFGRPCGTRDFRMDNVEPLVALWGCAARAARTV